MPYPRVMRDRAHEHARGAGREHRVRIQRDDVAAFLQRGRTADDGGKHVGTAAQELVELAQLAALALPPHPGVLLRVPLPDAMEQEEGILRPRRVPRIELAHG
jgi:hypothetical protein